MTIFYDENGFERSTRIICEEAESTDSADAANVFARLIARSWSTLSTDDQAKIIELFHSGYKYEQQGELNLVLFDTAFRDLMDLVSGRDAPVL